MNPSGIDAYALCHAVRNKIVNTAKALPDQGAAQSRPNRTKQRFTPHIMQNKGEVSRRPARAF
jgi:hypothetical protein